MSSPMELYYEKRAQRLMKSLEARHFEAYYCASRGEALNKALELIPEGASVSWGGAASAGQIGLLDTLTGGNYNYVGRDGHGADFFITGANAISMDGQMVNIDGLGNRVSAIIYGPKKVLVVAGMNKVVDSLEDAIRRARTVAAPMNQQRFLKNTPCTVTGSCADCKSEDCICNHIVITRHSRPTGRIVFLLVGEELGF